jgi:hypothetical protein
MDAGLARTRTSWRGAVALCATVALAAGSVHVAWGGVGAPPPAAQPSPAAGLEVSVILPALHAERTPAFTPESLIARPVFSATRRPREEIAPALEAEAPEPAAAPAPPAPPSYLVDGVMVFAETRKILLRRQPREPGQWLSQGDTTQEGWTILSIRADEIVLEQGGRSVAMSPRMRRSLQ